MNKANWRRLIKSGFVYRKDNVSLNHDKQNYPFSRLLVKKHQILTNQSRSDKSHRCQTYYFYTTLDTSIIKSNSFFAIFKWCGRTIDLHKKNAWKKLISSCKIIKDKLKGYKKEIRLLGFITKYLDIF